MRESLIRSTEKRLVCFVLNTYIDTCVCVHVAAEKGPMYNSLVFTIRTINFTATDNLSLLIRLCQCFLLEQEIWWALAPRVEWINLTKLHATYIILSIAHGENLGKRLTHIVHNTVLDSFPGHSHFQFLIACSMQKWKGKAWEKKSRAWCQRG